MRGTGHVMVMPGIPRGFGSSPLFDRAIQFFRLLKMERLFNSENHTNQRETDSIPQVSGDKPLSRARSSRCCGLSSVVYHGWELGKVKKEATVIRASCCGALSALTGKVNKLSEGY